jgi:tyrosine decarboxylase/aspartate 1-decarboxylase
MYWPKRLSDEIRQTVFEALAHNVSYSHADVLGFPGSFLDREVFPDAPFLREHAYLRCLRENPNHIGCHTITQAEVAFVGTQRLEVELLRICAEEILGAPPGGYDGYVCSGGTESNLEALWIHRNYFRDVHGARSAEVAVIHSVDTHYSITKGGDLLGISTYPVIVDEATRQMLPSSLRGQVERALAAGGRHFILVLNMGTTMFGSIDDLDAAARVLGALGITPQIHVDASFGGFIFPFTVEPGSADPRLDFRDPRVASVTMDGHKMLQAPYGTGVFLARKGLIDHVCTDAATYVHGKDFTLCGSRSGANAVALWMILHSYGSNGGQAFVRELIRRTDRLCDGLDALGVHHFRDPRMNVVAIVASDVPRAIAERFMLVPDTHDGQPTRWKVVVMDHVGDAAIDRFLGALDPRSRAEQDEAVRAEPA